jgi:hypothetical protein
MVNSVAAHLLGSHVAHGAHDNSRTRVMREYWSGLIGDLLGFDKLGEAEVQNPNAAIFCDEQILRLEVTMNDTLLVRSREPIRDLNAIIDRFAKR